MKDSTEKTFGFDNVGKIQTVCLSGRYADERVNAMLQIGWKILDSYKEAYEIDTCCAGGSRLYFVLGHENPNAQVPLTESEIKDQREEEEQRKRAEEYWRKVLGKDNESS